MMTREQYKIVGITALGGALEFYDFTIYALFATYISPHFFAISDPFVALMDTFLVFALGYFARPLGGIVFGHFGDRWGRKTAFSLSILLMAGATLGIGLLPSYESVGIIAPIGLLLLRLLQGFSVGGEIPGAAIFTIEHVPVGRRGLAIGLVFMSITLGNSLGASVGLLLTGILSQEQMMSWGWRLPFVIGFVLGIVSYLIRKKLFETPVFLNMIEQGKLQHKPLLKLLTTSRKQLLRGFLLTAVSSGIISLFLYLPTYLSNILYVHLSHAFLINFITFLGFAICTAFFGWGSDYIGRRNLLATGAIFLIIASYPFFCGLTRVGEHFVWIFSLAFAIFGGMINGSFAVLITECFPAAIRYSGVGLCYSLGMAVFGGTAPLAFTWLIHNFNMPEAPSLYLIGCGICTLAAVLMGNRDGNALQQFDAAEEAALTSG